MPSITTSLLSLSPAGSGRFQKPKPDDEETMCFREEIKRYQGLRYAKEQTGFQSLISRH